jgi:hypothetical protein
VPPGSEANLEEKPMDVTTLRSAYDRFLDAARDLGGAHAPEGEWPPELVLAHVIVGDRMIAEAAAQVLRTGEARYDNRASQSVPYLEAIAAAAGSWDGLLAAVRQSAEELMAVAAHIEPEHARVMVPTYVVDHDHVVIDGPAPLEQLVMVPAMMHLSGHADQLKSYVG